MKAAISTVFRTTLCVGLVVLATTTGCDDPSAQVAREAADRQAAQNVAMAGLQREVAAGSRQLVEQEGVARAQTLEIHRDLQAERGQVAASWNNIEAERQQIARTRRTDSFWAAILPAGGGVIAAVLALAFAWLVLFGLRRADDSADVASQLLIEQLLAPDGSVTPIDVAYLPFARALDGNVAGLIAAGSPQDTEPPSHEDTA